MIDLVYIASPSFSGSTLLTFLLNGHSEIATVGELKWGNIDLATYSCSCGERLAQCSFWTLVKSRVEATGVEFDLARPLTDFRFRSDPLADRMARARLRGRFFESVRGAVLATLPTTRRNWSTIAAINREVMSAAMEYKSARMFLDASKDPVRLKHLYETGDYRIHLIELVRDGRAVSFSARKNEGVSIVTAANEWRRTHLQIEQFSRYAPACRRITIRYEDLCTNVAGTLDTLSAYLNLSDPISEAGARTAEHHILGNRMRLKPLTSVRLSDEWREGLSAPDQAGFQLASGTLNRAFGYC